MTADAFRRLALNLPEAVESAHMNHPDFRVGGKIFAPLGPDESWGMVKLKPKQQRELVDQHPKVFEPFKGAWGRKGCTKVHLRAATKAALLPALVAAWTNTVPPKLLKEIGEA